MTDELLNYRQSVEKAISPDFPTGELLSEDKTFEFVEQQMMKVGSLAHGEVKWLEAEASILDLISNKSKDIRLLVFLMQCLHSKNTPERFVVSIQVMAAFIECYWQTCFPIPGKKGEASRKKFLSLMLQRISLVIDKLEFSHTHSDLRNELLQSMQQWHHVICSIHVCVEESNSVFEQVSNRLKMAEDSALDQAEKPIANNIRSVSQSIEVKSKSDNGLSKKALLDVAGRLFEQDFGELLSIRVRRFAIWGGISSPPEHNSKGETNLRGIYPERLKAYQDQLNQPSLELWRQVEQSLTLSPFWLDGQLMSYLIAQRLDKPGWCSVIAEETIGFLTRIPKLNELQFKGGEPFVSDDVKDWIFNCSHSTHQKQSCEWKQIKSEAINTAKEQSVAHALTMLNEGLERADEPREQFYWRLITADVMHENNLTALAQEQYQILHQQASSMQVSDWEPQLISRLQTIQRQSK